jgi:hypothetical protein
VHMHHKYQHRILLPATSTITSTTTHNRHAVIMIYIGAVVRVGSGCMHATVTFLWCEWV